MIEELDTPVTTETKERLERECKKRALDSIPETIRTIVSEALAKG